MDDSQAAAIRELLANGVESGSLEVRSQNGAAAKQLLIIADAGLETEAIYGIMRPIREPRKVAPIPMDWSIGTVLTAENIASLPVKGWYLEKGIRTSFGGSVPPGELSPKQAKRIRDQILELLGAGALAKVHRRSVAAITLRIMYPDGEIFYSIERIPGKGPVRKPVAK